MMVVQVRSYWMCIYVGDGGDGAEVQFRYGGLGMVA